MGEDMDNGKNESILYEVLEYFAKKQEPELTKFKNDFIILPTSGTIKNALRYLNNRYSLPESISEQISFTLPWKFAIGNNGRILAVLHENLIEIRKSKDEYSSVVGKASVPKDAFPQWRKLAWSPDGSILALASSNGYMSFYNSYGNNIFNITPKTLSQNPNVLEAGDATASMIFKKPRVESEAWDFEFIRVTYSGLLKSYCISASAFSENHEFSFGNFYRNGVNCVLYSDHHNLFFVAGNNGNHILTGSASEIGLTCWRTLNDHPYYKLSVNSEDFELFKSHFSIWQFIPMMKNRAQSLIFKASISPNNQLISCLHTDGTISIWSLPTLKLQNQWKLSEQPNFNAANPLKTMKFKKSVSNVSEFQPLDIGWWSDNIVIIARYSGSVSVCSTNNLTNLLGASPEFLYNHPQIAELGDAKGFLSLDCEVIVTSKKRNRDSTGEGHASEVSSDSEKEEDESKSTTILNYTTSLVQSALYSITDIEKFQPKRKKSKIFHRTYRLIGIKSTTPEELYTRKIEIEAYEEALTLAKTYNLDPDLVYQTQWRKSEFSVTDIQNHLSKVSKRSWVLNECVSRVPESLEATRELLNFGLRGANLETLAAISLVDDGKFTSGDMDDDDSLDDSSIQLTKIQKINKMIEKIVKKGINESQKQLILCRKNLLEHLDKLQTYEILLESPTKFDKQFYEEFRSLSPVENAIKFAKTANCRGVEIMFTYYGAKLMPHWLTIISFFPETLNPEKYIKLLPECDIEGRLFLLYQQELRQKDWVERSAFSHITDSEYDDDMEFIYENRRSLSVYRRTELSQELLQKWYSERAYEIERDSRLIDNALALINIGKSHNISGLEKLLFELETLDDLVYKVGLEELSLTEVEKLNDLDKIKLLMTKSDANNFVNNIKTKLLPYSRRRNRYIGDSLNKDLLYEYLVYLSKHDLQLPAEFFEYLKSSYDPEILDSIESITSLAMDCLYACSSTEMYSKAKAIFDATVIHTNNMEDIIKKYAELENELKCLQTLSKYGLQISLQQINKCKLDSTESKALLTQMSENLINIYPQPSEKNWSQMLNDIFDIQEHTFTCLDIEICFDISMIARLKSKKASAIQGCKNLMEMKKSGRSHLKVSFERAIDIILEISSNYFNNAKSLSDPDMDLARECLHLISENDSRVKEEYDLIESLQILDEFNINILPIQVRMTQDRIKLIEDCLNSRNDAYKNKQKLLNLSKYLKVERKNKHLREGRVLNLISKKAFEREDYTFCSSTIQEMIKNNYQPAWEVAMNLGCCDNYDNLQIRRRCIWFTINNGPSERIENLMRKANLLQIQILNNDLDRWMPPEENTLQSQTENAEGNVDEIFKPLTDNNEFVPKIVQTSAGLVKSSAQIVTQSTFDLIRRAGNKGFWASTLNFNFAESTPKLIADDEIIIKKQEEKFLKFPCFYETLHNNCGISNLGTKYSKYSLDDFNSKLKLCQSLLRISLLGETASYGAEISDVNNLLLECTEHTIQEDCLTALSYLLSLEDNCFSDILDLCESLKPREFYSQLFAYFFSIKLYSKVFPDSNKVFFYDPIELIQQMAKVKILNDDSSNNKNLKEQINFLLKMKSEDDRPEKNLTIEPTEEKETKKKLLDCKNSHEEIEKWDSWGHEWNDDSELKENDNDITKKNKTESDIKKIDECDNKWSDSKFKVKDETKEDNAISTIQETNDWDNDWKDDFDLETQDNMEKLVSPVNQSPITEPSDWDNDWDVKSDSGNQDNIEKPISPIKESPVVESSHWGNDWDDESDSGNQDTIEKSVLPDEESPIKESPIVESSDWDNDWDDKSDLGNSDNIKTFTPSDNVAGSSGWDNNWDDKSDTETKNTQVPNTTDDIKDENYWDNDWNDHSDSEIQECDKETGLVDDDRAMSAENNEPKVNLELDTDPHLKESNDWDDEWNDNPDFENSNTADTNIISKKDNDDMTMTSDFDNLSKEEKCQIFKEQFSQIQNLNDYRKVKEVLFQWPSINDLSSYTDDGSYLALLMIEKIKDLCSNSNSDETVLSEIKDFLHKEMIPQDVFAEFLNEKKQIFTLEQLIYLELCSKETTLQQQAIKSIKENYKALSLNSLIYEEIFFNNLTSSFDVNHDLYYKILEEVFTNRTLTEIEDNVKLLIENLVKQKNIPHAIALFNQIEGIPSSLSTYENCFKLLIQKYT